MNRRQSGTDKAADTLKPDSSKSTMEQATDKVKGATDSVAGSAQPGIPPNILYSPPMQKLTHTIEGDKSVTQSATDAVSGSGVRT